MRFNLTLDTFRTYTLRDAECELVGACIDHEVALLVALEELPLADFRSSEAYDLQRIFYVLAGWLERGTWDRLGNRERLAHYFDDYYLDGLWCPYGMIEAYVRTLCRAITGSNTLADEAVAAQHRRLFDNPLRRQDEAEHITNSNITRAWSR